MNALKATSLDNRMLWLYYDMVNQLIGQGQFYQSSDLLTTVWTIFLRDAETLDFSLPLTRRNMPETLILFVNLPKLFGALIKQTR